MQRVDAIREVRITEQTYYRWRKQCGGMGTDQLKELMRLQKENEREPRRVCRRLIWPGYAAMSDLSIAA
jgi:hypothetical protein